VSSGPLVLGFPSYADAARRLAAKAALGYADVVVHRFPDGESQVRLPPALPDEVVFCVSLDRPNDKLVELELAACAARDLGARHLTLVAPYLCYMRQDMAFHPGEAVSQRIIGALLARHFETVITVDAHLHRTAELSAAIPVPHALNLSAAGAIGDWLVARGGRPVLLGPDEESAQWVREAAAAGHLDWGIAHKDRHGDRDVRVTLPGLDFAGRDVVLVDDVASTGHSLAAAARLLRDRGAGSIDVAVTHALFVGDALDLLRDAGVNQIASTDSVPHASNALALDGLLAAAL
jgi:ribose-phosphate pyrophosphokinase